MDFKINKILKSLQASTFRARFNLSDKDLQYINDKGLNIIRKHAFDFIIKKIAPPFPKNDGKQTPMKNHPIFIAQHATATCCRSCLQKWHGIKKGKELSERETLYIVNVIMTWIERKIEHTLK